jgi:peptidoglycan/LPS O-acetylase OafA/YrhL
VTLGQRLEITGGRPSGFDYLRIALACSVIVTHSVGITYGNDFAVKFFSIPGVHALSMIILPMFFSLSGFLVAGSAARARSLIGFLGLRAIRIYPALMVEVTLSAFILGPFFTNLPLGQYFTDPVFFRYLVNVTGHISFYLPGVFHLNPSPDLVNYQLWTVPFELYCYASISVLMLIGATKRPTLFLILSCALTAVAFARHLHSHWQDPFIPDFAGHISGSLLVCSFLFGVSAFLFADKLPWSKSWGILSAILTIVLLSIPLGEYLAVITAAYLTVYLGLMNPEKRGILRGADYSYGVYLYGWPVQQALVAAFPWSRIWWVNMILALILSGAFAALSWHFIEKPALAGRKPLKAFEEKWLAAKRHRFAQSALSLLARRSGT